MEEEKCVLTVDEAEEKWCPMTRISGAGGSGCISNRGFTDKDCYRPMSMNCISRDCMAWRWDSPQEYEVRLGEKPEGDEWIDDGVYENDKNEMCRLWKRPRPIPRRGHCGLAGKPT